MAIELTVNGNTYSIPENRENPGWGEELTSWMDAITDVAAGITGVGDILQTSVTIANNTASATNLAAFTFDPGTVRGAEITYAIYRNTSASELAEFGKIYLVFKTVAGTWDLSQTFAGSSGVTLTITSLGQMQYTSTNMAGTGYAGTIKYFAKAITI